MADSHFSFGGVAEKVVGGVLSGLILLALAGGVGMGWIRLEEWWWAAPMMYALVTGVSIFGVLYGLSSQIRTRRYWWGFSILLICLFVVLLYVDRKSQKPTAVSSSAPVIVSPIPPPAKPDSLRLVEGWREKVRLSVLKIPRPCTIRVAAAPGSVDIRSDLHFVIKEAEVMEGISGRVLIPPCHVPDDLRDSKPDSYMDRPSDAPPGIIVVNAADSQIAELLASAWGDLGPKVKVGKTLPSEGPADLIYIQVGPREPLGK